MSGFRLLSSLLTIGIVASTLAASTAAGATELADLPPNLVAYWSFDEDFTASDSLGSVPAFDGIQMKGASPDPLNGPSIDPAAGYGGAAYFDSAEEQYVLIEQSVLPGVDHTYSAWYRLEVDDITYGDRYFVLETIGDGEAYSASYGLRSESGGTDYGQVYTLDDSGLPGSSSHVDVPGAAGTGWHNIIVTYDADATGQEHTIYLDGNEVGIMASASDLMPTTGLHIGNYRALAENRFWQGWIDEVAFWDRVLTEEEIGQVQDPLAFTYYKALGLDESWYVTGSLDLLAPEDTYSTDLIAAAWDASSCDPGTGSVLITTGLATDRGRGDTDLANPGLPESCRFSFTIRFPEEVNRLDWRTQARSAEYTYGIPGNDDYDITLFTASGFPDTTFHLGPTKHINDLTGYDTIAALHPVIEPSIWLTNSMTEDRELVFTIETVDNGDGNHDSSIEVFGFRPVVTEPFSLPSFRIHFECEEPNDSTLPEGSYTFAKDLIDIPSPMPLRFSVLYNSLNPRETTLGVGWVHSYDITLFQDEEDSTVIIQHGNGLMSPFDPDGAGGFRPSSPSTKGELSYEYGTFVHVNDNFMTTVFFPMDDKDESYQGYHAHRITDRHGNQTNFDYDYAPDAPNREVLARVDTANGNNYLSFSYYGSVSPRLEYVEANGITDVIQFYHRPWPPNPPPPAPPPDPPTPTKLTKIWANTGAFEGEPVTTEFTYDENAKLFELINGEGDLQVQNWYLDGLLTMQQKEDYSQAWYTHDEDAKTVTYRDFENNTTARTYDVDGRLVSLEKQSGTSTFEYDVSGNPTRVIDAAFGVTEMRYEDNNLVSYKDAGGDSLTMEYDDRNNLLRRVDQAGHEWTFAYDANDHMVSKTDPLGNVTSYTYDSLGQLRSQADPRGGTTYFGYDSHGFVNRITDALGGVTHINNDPLGNPVSTTNANGFTTFTEHDYLGNLVSVTDALGNETRYTYDEAGRKVEEWSNNFPAPDQRRTYTYTPEGYVASVQSGDDPAFVFGYDDEGHRTSIQDPMNQETTLEYDTMGRLKDVTDPEGGTTHVDYDACSQTSIRDPNGNTVSTTFDALGRLVTERNDALNHTVSYDYDKRGLLVQITNGRDQAINIQRDDAGRETGRSFPGGSINHALDPVGNRTTSSSNTYANVSRTYDAANRMVARSDQWGRTVEYRYDAVGNVVEIVYPDGASVHYTYDAANRLESVTDWDGRVTAYEYTTGGNLLRVHPPDGSVVDLSYDSAQRVIVRNDFLPGHGILFGGDYTRNGLGHITTANMILPIEPEPILVYDEFTYMANTIGDIGGQACIYDADGNMTSGFLDGNPTTFQYDPLNRLQSTNGDSYFYDVDGYRVETNFAGQIRRYVYDPLAPTPKMLVEYDDAGVLVARYVHGHGLISREDAGGNVSVYHYDHRGNTVALTTLGGQITDTYAYGPYGRVLARAGTTANPFLFCGQHGVMDDGNGLNFMRLRYYAPSLARFIQKDQVDRGGAVQSQSLNRHIYAAGNPILRIDPNGDHWLLDVGIAILDFTTDSWNGESIGIEDIFSSVAAIAGAFIVGTVGGGFFAVEIAALVVGNMTQWAMTGEFSWSWEYSLIGAAIDIFSDSGKIATNDADDSFNDFWPEQEVFDGGMSPAAQSMFANGMLTKSVCPLR